MIAIHENVRTRKLRTACSFAVRLIKKRAAQRCAISVQRSLA